MNVNSSRHNLINLKFHVPHHPSSQRYLVQLGRPADKSLLLLVRGLQRGENIASFQPLPHGNVVDQRYLRKPPWERHHLHS